ncbi:hypothetical protein V6N11_072756 [Hibiscus sabdariffa]|uniref:non-specific serine/threonine protein kinase n=1 Tax=Hibiscus sabdariffa TaxID=183260 RepID=A0ABR2NE09_9ROSI
MPAADQSPFESEAEALLESGWWSGTLHVGCNRPLYVNIPSQIGDLSALKRLSLSHCDLSGTGAYGSVHRAQLPCGKVVALKKLRHSEVENSDIDNSFRNEIKFLTKIRHRNIVKLYRFCLHRRSMFLIYEYIEKGSCIAHALCYLHHDCSRPIVHRDISSNNVLLNLSLQAVVADFGPLFWSGSAGNMNGKASGRSVVVVVVSIFFSKCKADPRVRQSSSISDKPTGCTKSCSSRGQ